MIAMRNSRKGAVVCALLALQLTVGCSGDDEDSPEKEQQGDPNQVEQMKPAASAFSERFPPITASGQPIEAPEQTWTYVEFADTKCRDGSPAGIAVSLNRASRGLMIYLEGGGACFDAITCGVNPSNAAGQRGEKTLGLFNRAQADNPVRDWNFVYVPYCTGDTHGGTKPNGMVAGVQGAQQFVGQLNLKTFLQRIVPTVSDPSDVLLTGVSAGGFGAAQNGVLVQRHYPKVKIRVIDDSGPPLSSAVVPACLQKKWRETWGLENSVLADCGAECSNVDDYSQAFGLAGAKLFDDRPTGLIESSRDSIIAGFYGAGLNDCTGIALLNAVPPEVFEADLLAYREKVRPFANFSTYIPSGTKHTWLGDDAMYTANISGVRLVDWVAKIIRGESPGHVGP